MIRFRVRGGFWLLAALAVVFCGLDTALSALAAVLLHEGAHLLAARLFRGVPEEVTLSARGVGVRVAYPGVTGYVCDAVTAAAGPAANLTAGAALAAAAGGNRMLLTLAGTNLVLGLFNLIPADGFDGGTVVAAGLKRFLPLETAEKLCRILGWVSAAGILGAGVWLWWATGNVSLIVFGALTALGAPRRSSGRHRGKGLVETAEKK